VFSYNIKSKLKEKDIYIKELIGVIFYGDYYFSLLSFFILMGSIACAEIGF
jgi:hypothetical protein